MFMRFHGLLFGTIFTVGPVLIWPLSTDGQNWIETSAPVTNWTAVACSADGAKLVAVAGGSWAGPSPGPIYLSTNSGSTWTPSGAPITNWNVVCCSADGTKLAAALYST